MCLWVSSMIWRGRLATGGPQKILWFVFWGEGGTFLFTSTPRMRRDFLSWQSLQWLRGRTIGALCAERHTSTSANGTSCSACHELRWSRAFLFIILRYTQDPNMPRVKWIWRGTWPTPLPLLIYSALACFLRCTHSHILPAACASVSIGFWVISSPSSATWDWISPLQLSAPYHSVLACQNSDSSSSGLAAHAHRMKFLFFAGNRFFAWSWIIILHYNFRNHWRVKEACQTISNVKQRSRRDILPRVVEIDLFRVPKQTKSWAHDTIALTFDW